MISVVWTYEGLPAAQMEQQITQSSNVARIESDSFDGVSVLRVFLQPDADVATAMAQITAISQTIVRRMPPGTPSVQYVGRRTTSPRASVSAS